MLALGTLHTLDYERLDPPDLWINDSFVKIINPTLFVILNPLFIGYLSISIAMFYIFCHFLSSKG